MRTWATLFLLAGLVAARAHIGSPNVFLEDKAGPYSVRVVIRPPQVVPGLAEITVRVHEPVKAVTVLPVFSRAGRAGSPPPDEAKLLQGDTNLYTASLWLMKSGAYSVDVSIDGPLGQGTLVVPVNSVATNTRPMSRLYGTMLCLLAGILFAGGLSIARAIFRESRLGPGGSPTAKDRWRGRVAMVVTGGILSLLVLGGKKWWDAEDRHYRNNSLYKPVPVSVTIQPEKGQNILGLEINAADRRGKWTPLLPDHGKWMHLFLVRAGTPGAFAHLHPVLRSPRRFDAPLPPLPAGQYHVYADVTHEDGFAETLVAELEMPPASLAMKRLWLGNSAEPICSAVVSQMLADKLAFPPGADDSWQIDPAPNSSANSGPSGNGAPRSADASGGYRIIWENPADTGRNPASSPRFHLLAPDNRPAPIEPYMGMLGHAVVRRHDGAVFAHLHPAGTISMAAQQFFLHGGPGPDRLPVAATGRPATLQNTNLLDHSNHTNEVGVYSSVSFPYVFPEPGNYRLWVQLKSEGRILTGVFDTIAPRAE